MPRNAGICSLVILLQLGCMTEGPLYEQRAHPGEIAMASYRVTINDRRSMARVQEFSLPSALGEVGAACISPALDSVIEKRAHQAVENARIPGSRDLVFTVDVFIGCKKSAKNLFTTEEFVKWRLRVQASENGNEVPGLSAIGDSWGRRVSRDIPPNHLRNMFLDSFTDALQDALARMKE